MRVVTEPHPKVVNQFPLDLCFVFVFKYIFTTTTTTNTITSLLALLYESPDRLSTLLDNDEPHQVKVKKLGNIS